MRRTLLLDEDDLIMVVKQDVVRQIDQNRGELTRSEFVTHLIQYQLKECYEQKNYVTREELQQFTQEITDLLQNFLQFFVSYGMAMGRGLREGDIQSLSQQLQSFCPPEEENGDFTP